MNIRNLRDENNSLREEAKRTAADNAARLAAAKNGKTNGGDQISLGINEAKRDEGILDALGVSGSTPEEKVSALEKYLENKRTADNPGGTTRSDKIKYIESLLRGGISTDD